MDLLLIVAGISFIAGVFFVAIDLLNHILKSSNDDFDAVVTKNESVDRKLNLQQDEQIAECRIAMRADELEVTPWQKQ